jgi:hypothetical protein
VTGRLIICFMLINIASYGQPSTSQIRPEPLQVTVCEVTHSPEKFMGKRIFFHALVLSDGIERTVLIDDKATCERGISPLSMSDKAADALSKALSQGRPGTIDKRILGTFVGVFSLVSPETVGLSPHFKRVCVVRVESLSNLEVTPTYSSSH